MAISPMPHKDELLNMLAVAWANAPRNFGGVLHSEYYRRGGTCSPDALRNYRCGKRLPPPWDWNIIASIFNEHGAALPLFLLGQTDEGAQPNPDLTVISSFPTDDSAYLPVAV